MAKTTRTTNKTISRSSTKSEAPASSSYASAGGNGGTMTAPAPAARPTHDQIAKRAYEIWVAKGRPAGRDLENWKQAERELGMR